MTEAFAIYIFPLTVEFIIYIKPVQQHNFLFFQLEFHSHLNEMHSQKLKSKAACTIPCKWRPSKGSFHCIYFKQILLKDFWETMEYSQVLWARKDNWFNLCIFSI